MMLALYGPTATGKTDLALRLAKKYNGELISADSRQIYKGLDVGTGKIQSGHKVSKHSGYWKVDNIKIHGFDLVGPGEGFSVADFLKFAQEAISQINKKNKTPILVGGTGFYFKALIDGIDSLGIPRDSKLRKNLEKLSAGELYQKLESVDEKRAAAMNLSDRQNPRRLIRAIEIATSRSIIRPPNYPTIQQGYLLICLTAPNNYLYERADKWLIERLESGMIAEVRALMRKGVNKNWLVNLGLEYRWLTKYLISEIDKNDAVERLKGDIHSFIRRQKTWLGKFKNKQTFDIFKKGWQNQLEKNVNLWYNRTNDGK